MGQQQLLLLVLATVIVGLATVAGIQAFEQGQNRANQDALTSTAVKIASDVQARIKEPSQFGGYDGNISSGTVNATGSIGLQELGYSTNGSSDFSLSTPVYEASSGECSLNNSSSPITINCESDQATVTVKVDGLKPGDIETTNQTIKS